MSCAGHLLCGMTADAIAATPWRYRARRVLGLVIINLAHQRWRGERRVFAVDHAAAAGEEAWRGRAHAGAATCVLVASALPNLARVCIYCVELCIVQRLHRDMYYYKYKYIMPNLPQLPINNPHKSARSQNASATVPCSPSVTNSYSKCVLFSAFRRP